MMSTIGWLLLLVDNQEVPEAALNALYCNRATLIDGIHML